MSAIPARHQVRLPRYRLRASATAIFRLRSVSVPAQKPKEDAVEVVCISDTHNLQPTLPPGDILVHAGDLTEWGTFEEMQTQLNWLSSQPHAHKILIAGNHDILFDTAFLEAYPEHKQKNGARTKADLDFGNVTYLQDQSITLHLPTKGGRHVNVYGSPWTPLYGTSAFQYPKAVDKWRKKVPLDTDILITHGPPAGHLDGLRNAGCAYLLSEVQRVRPTLIVCGHIHVARGEEHVVFDTAQVLYEDVISGRRGWEVLPWLGLAVLWSHVRGAMGLACPRSTTLINASIIDGMAKDKAFSAFVVEI